MNDNRLQLTHNESQGVLKDIFERLASHRGHLWYQAIKRFLVASNTEFYMLNIGSYGTLGSLRQAFSQAGFSISPFEGGAEKSLMQIRVESYSGKEECFRMVPVRAMDFERTKQGSSNHENDISRIRHIGLMEGLVTTSWEAACNLLLETVKEKSPFGSRRTCLLEIVPSPIVWTFVSGNSENRQNFSKVSQSSESPPILVGLVSEDAGLGFKGIAEADYLHELLGRKPGTILPTDIFLFSIDVKKYH